MKRLGYLLIAIMLFMGSPPVGAQETSPKDTAGVPSYPYPQREKSTIKGKVTQILPPIAALTTGKGQVYIRLGPWWFWRQRGYVLRVGEVVEVQGYLWNNYLIPITIKTPHQTIVLRNQAGFPLWRGGMGRRHRFWGGRCFGCAPLNNNTTPTPATGNGRGRYPQ